MSRRDVSRSTLVPGSAIWLDAGDAAEGLSVQRLEDGSWRVGVRSGQRLAIQKAGGPVSAAGIRIRCSTDRGWVIEREVRAVGSRVEWCAIPRFMAVDARPGDELAFVEEDYSHHERDSGQDPPPHVTDALEWPVR